MSVCGQAGQTEEDSGSEEVTTVAVSTGSGIRDIYKQKSASKVVRVLTVVAYLLSVSLAAILLSVYYVCVWKSPVLPKAEDNDTAALQALLADNNTDLHHHLNSTSYNNYTGGSDSSINALVDEPADGSSSSTPSSESSEPGSSASDTLSTESYDFTTDDYVTDDPRTIHDNENVT